MKSYGWVAGATAIFVVIVLVASGTVLYGDPNRGTFGDMFGFANALFSGVVFIGVTYAIFLQREEIRIAREDIKYTKAILDEQQTQLALQNGELRQQKFENTFFKLIDQFVSTSNLVERHVNNQPVRGRALFR